MVSLFWDKDGFIHAEFMPRSTTINANRLLRYAARTVGCYWQKERWTSVAKCDTSAQYISDTIFVAVVSPETYSPYSTDLALSECHLFGPLR